MEQTVVQPFRYRGGRNLVVDDGTFAEQTVGKRCAGGTAFDDSQMTESGKTYVARYTLWQTGQISESLLVHIVLSVEESNRKSDG